MEQAAAFAKPTERKHKLHLTDTYTDVLKLMLAHL